MRDEAFTRAIDKAAENELITQEEADTIKQWWAQKPKTQDPALIREWQEHRPEVPKPRLLQHVSKARALHRVHLQVNPRAEFGPRPPVAKVAEILGIPKEELVSAFREAQQEMRDEAFTRAIDKAAENDLITQEEADAIKQWWAQKPEALGLDLLQRARCAPALPSSHMWGGHRGWR